MPEYTFKCRKCSHKTSLFCSFTEYDAKKNKGQNAHHAKVRKWTEILRQTISEGSFPFPSQIARLLENMQTSSLPKYTRTQREDMIEQFKTKKSGGMKKLPTGMSRINKASKKKGK